MFPLLRSHPYDSTSGTAGEMLRCEISIPAYDCGGHELPKGDVRVESVLPPCVDGSELARTFFTYADWSVRPCVRPVARFT